MKAKKLGIMSGEISIVLSDAASHREMDDVNGRMLVSDTQITKESVDSYFGREIPGYEAFGLAPEKVYKIYRPAAELKKALKKFNNIPLLDMHILDYGDAPQKDHRVGSVSNARMDGGTVFADLGIWDKDAIKGIQDGSRKELSCGYQADTIYKPGVFDGEEYTFLMKNILPNHLSLVPRARCPGSKVFDEKPTIKEPEMEKEEFIKLVSSEMDAAGIDKNIAEKIILKIQEYKPEDKPEDKPEIKDEPKPEEAKPEDPKPEAKTAAEVHPKPEVSEDAKEEVKEKVEKVEEEVKPEPKPEEPKPEVKPEDPKPEAVPAQPEIKKEEIKESVKLEDMPGFAEAVKEAVKSALAEISEAKEAVEDVCGKMSAMDSAEDLYKAGCSYFGIKTEGRDPKEFKILFEGAKAGMSKPTKTAVLDSKPEQPEVEEPDFLKNLPKRRY